MTDPNKYASPEQLRYAKVLGVGVQIGFVMLVISFLLYVFGVLQPLVPLDQLPKYWGLSASEFVKATHTPTGWSWLPLVGKGDMLNLVGIAVLAGLSGVSSAAVLPIFAKRRETALLVITLLQIVVLAVSASNILAMLR
jgi:ABC-type Na+ efflux pump permease subunit